MHTSPSARRRRAHSHPGEALVEALVATAILGILTVALAQLLMGAYRSTAQSQQRTAALFHAQQGLEAVRSIAAARFSPLQSGTYGIGIVAGHYALSSTPDTLNGMTRTISISVAQRNAGGSIVPTGGTADPSTVSIVSTVSWSAVSGTASVSLQTYLTDWRSTPVKDKTKDDDKKNP